MNFGQQLEQRGFKKGIQKGMQKGMQASHQDVWQASKVETAQKLLLAKVDRATIQRATGLTEEELEALAHMAHSTEQ